MAEVLIKYDARNSIAKKTLEFFLSLGIFEVEGKTEENKRVYNSEFIEKIKQSEKSGKWKAIKTSDIWVARADCVMKNTKNIKPLWFTIITTLCLVAVTLFVATGCNKPTYYTINFVGEGVDIEPQSIEHGKYATAPENPEREDYDFCGWFTDNSTFSNKWDFETNIVTQNTTLYVKWKRSNINSCGVENPITDLPWLKKKIDEITLELQEGLFNVAIYQCTYSEEQTGFLVDRGNIKFFYNCEGKAIGAYGGTAGEQWPPHLNIDLVNKKLLWEANIKKRFSTVND